MWPELPLDDGGRPLLSGLEQRTNEESPREGLYREHDEELPLQRSGDEQLEEEEREGEGGAPRTDSPGRGAGGWAWDIISTQEEVLYRPGSAETGSGSAWPPFGTALRDRSLQRNGLDGLKRLIGNRASLKSASSMLRRRLIGDGGLRSVESLVKDDPPDVAPPPPSSGFPEPGRSKSRSRSR